VYSARRPGESGGSVRNEPEVCGFAEGLVQGAILGDVDGGDVADAVLRGREQAQVGDVAALERNHKGAWERDTTSEEEALILAAKREARAKLVARSRKTRK
jgi:hypothetical protein